MRCRPGTEILKVLKVFNTPLQDDTYVGQAKFLEVSESVSSCPRDGRVDAVSLTSNLPDSLCPVSKKFGIDPGSRDREASGTSCPST